MSWHRVITHQGAPRRQAGARRVKRTPRVTSTAQRESRRPTLHVRFANIWWDLWKVSHQRQWNIE